MTQFLAVFLGIAMLGATTAAPAYAAAQDSTSQEVASLKGQEPVRFVGQ